jgi:replicative DNA helicase
VVAGAQLNRQPDDRRERRPGPLTGLRDSGALGHIPDLVIMVHRDDAYDQESARAGEADLTIAKHRYGPAATATVAFQGPYSRFVDMPPL